MSAEDELATIEQKVGGRLESFETQGAKLHNELIPDEPDMAGYEAVLRQLECLLVDAGYAAQDARTVLHNPAHEQNSVELGYARMCRAFGLVRGFVWAMLHGKDSTHGLVVLICNNEEVLGIIQDTLGESQWAARRLHHHPQRTFEWPCLGGELWEQITAVPVDELRTQLIEAVDQARTSTNRLP